MPGHTHLNRFERDQIAELKVSSHGVRAIALAPERDPSSISRELMRNACEQGSCRPVFAEGSYLYRRQRAAILEKDLGLRAFVLDRLAEGWTPEQIAGWLSRGVERGLPTISSEAIYTIIFRATQKLWRYLVRRKATRGRRSKGRITDKTHISQQSGCPLCRQDGVYEPEAI